MKTAMPNEGLFAKKRHKLRKNTEMGNIFFGHAKNNGSFGCLKLISQVDFERNFPLKNDIF